MNLDNPVKVLQFGDGVFLHAFIDRMIQTMNDPGRFGDGICIVKPRPGASTPAWKR